MRAAAEEGTTVSVGVADSGKLLAILCPFLIPEVQVKDSSAVTLKNTILEPDCSALNPSPVIDQL